MITLYLWDEQGIYTDSVDVDEAAPMPERSTPTKPMKLTGTQVAQWQGNWVKLSARPVVPDPDPIIDPVIDWPALIAARRFIAEASGTTIDGMPIDTGRDSQGLITGAALQAMIDPEYSLHWKTSAGFVELTAQEIIGVATAVRMHVQNCFNREADLLAAVADGTITEAMLDEGWT
jgi:hypothetical protein